MDEKNPVICKIAGSSWPSTYVFNIKELPERCNIFTVGQYSFDRDDGTNLFVMESDKSIIKTLVEAKKTTYIHIGFDTNLFDWSTRFPLQNELDKWMNKIFNPSNEDEFQKYTLDPLIEFTSTSNIGGILINCPPMYYDAYIDGFAKHVSSFVTKVKTKAKYLKVGFIIPGFLYESFSNNTLLGFTILNEVLNFYVIQWGDLNECYQYNLKTGVSPITSTSRYFITIEQVTSGVINSTMDKLKIYANILTAPVIPSNLLPEGAQYYITTYTEGAYAKKNYAGLVLEQLDTDDYDGTCGCDKFPVSKLIIDGWTGNENKPLICNIAGSSLPSTGYVFNKDELPECCNMFTVGQFSFDLDPYVTDLDKSIIKTLVEAKKTTYIQIGYGTTNEWMNTIFNPSKEDEFQKYVLDPLIGFISTSNIGGIIISCPPIYYEDYIKDFAKHVSSFVTQVKSKATNIKVGFIIPSSGYEHFTNKTLLDFTILNDVLDFYIIAWGDLNYCHKAYLKTGVSPITSTTPDLRTVEKLTEVISNSDMDKSKVYASVLISAVIPFDSFTRSNTTFLKTYTEYCNNTNPERPLCTNPSKLSFDQGAYAKNNYAGLVLEQLDTDDYEGTCGCEKFPVSKLIIDGWTGSKFEACSKLDLS
ncbi:hypothetical protein ACI65C_008622 [Semiaphis heraclei]